MRRTRARLAALAMVGVLVGGCSDEGGTGDDGARDTVGGEESPGEGGDGRSTEGEGSGGDQGDDGITGG